MAGSHFHFYLFCLQQQPACPRGRGRKRGWQEGRVHCLWGLKLEGQLQAPEVTVLLHAVPVTFWLHPEWHPWPQQGLVKSQGLVISPRESEQAKQKHL